MSRNAVVTFALRHNIPRINRHHEVYYSRAHIDAIKEKQDKLNPDYYTYSEITEKYGLTKINISYYVNKYDITRFKQGSRTMVLRTEFDKVYREHRNGTYTPKKRESKSGQQGAERTFYNPRRILFVRTDCSHISDDQEKLFAGCAVKTTFLKSVTEDSTTTNSWQ